MKTTLAACNTVRVTGHAHAGTTGLSRAILSLSHDLTLVINRIELQNSKLDVLVRVLDLLRLGVDLLLSLLSTATETQHKVKGRLLLNIVIGKGTAVLELLTGEDQTLLIRGNTLLVLDLLLDIVNAIRGLNLESDGLTRKGLDEDLRKERKGVKRFG